MTMSRKDPETAVSMYAFVSRSDPAATPEPASSASA